MTGFFARLGTHVLGRKVYYKKTTASTNDDAMEGRYGDLFVADAQSAGRGRLDHKWFSPPGLNLYCSLVLDVSGLEPETVSTLPLVAGLAAAETADCFYGGVSLVKWPNDVLAEGMKICGILCRLSGTLATAGIGINVNETQFPEELSGRASSLRLLAGAEIDRWAVLAELMNNFEARYEEWKSAGFAPLAAELSKRDFLKGAQVSVLRSDSDPNPAAGLCGGIAANGALIVDGKEIFSGEAHVQIHSAHCI